MLRQLVIESGIVVTLTSLLLALAATIGLPGRPDRPARAAEVATESLSGPPGPLRGVDRGESGWHKRTLGR